MPFLSCGTVDIYYEIQGQGEALLFIHGLGSSTVDWNAQTNYFSKNYKVIVFDLRGHGQSGKVPGTYSISLFADDVACLIKKLNIQRANVVGISLGGMIGMHLAVYYPDLVKSLTVVNSPSEFPQKTPKARFQILLRFFIIKVMGMAWMGKVLASRIKNATLSIIKDSRHGTPLDQTEIFNKTVEGFLKRIHE